MTVRLRGHHLLCLLTYVGKGYSEGFVANYDRIAARIGAGETIELVKGPDDLCAPLLDDPHAHCRDESPALRDETALASLSRGLGRTLEIGSRIEPSAPLLEGFRSLFREGTTRAACEGCEWNGLCTAVASSNFAGARIDPGAPVRTAERP